MIESQKSLDYYVGARDALDHWAAVDGTLPLYKLLDVIDECEAEVMDRMAQSACTCLFKPFVHPECPVHGGKGAGE